MSKGLHIRLSAALVVVWYLFSVVGFDIHCCADNGMVYVEPLLAGISCEQIHPDCPCCHHGETCACDEDCHHCSEDEDCCSDTLERLSDPSVTSASPATPAPGLLAAVVPTPAPEVAQASFVMDRSLVAKDPPRERLSRICILRV